MHLTILFISLLVYHALARPTSSAPETAAISIGSNPAPATQLIDYTPRPDVSKISTAIDDRASDRSRGVDAYVKLLQAIYYYNCPGGGRNSREFRWQAKYRLLDGDLKVTAIQNISKFWDQQKGPHTFSTRWEGYDCVHVGERFCSYVFWGKTVGTIFGEGMTLSLITGGMPAGDNPTVSEICFDHVPQGICPVIPHNAVPRVCVINRVEVNVIL